MHETKALMIKILIETSFFFLKYNFVSIARPFPWLMKNMQTIVEKRKEENVGVFFCLKIFFD